jgi:hypothetical protein
LWPGWSTAPRAIPVGWRNVRRVLDRYSGGHLVGRHVLERDLWNALLYERHWQEVELHWHVAAVLDGI